MKLSHKTVCLGDSLTFGYGVQQHESWVSILNVNEVHLGTYINRGIPGNTTGQMKERYNDDVLSEKPKSVILLGGTNDMLMNLDIQIALNNMAEMITRSMAHSITPIVLLPLFINAEVKSKELFFERDYREANSMLTIFRQKLMEYTTNHAIDYFDLMKVFHADELRNTYYLNDGIHIVPEIHRRIANLLISERESTTISR